MPSAPDGLCATRGPRGLSGRSIRGLMTSVALAASAAVPALAQTLPAGPSVAAGAVSIATPSGTSVIIDQTSKNAVINWNSFSIGAGNSVAINNGSGATLNRVTGNIPSRIDGALTATGSVYLVNPAGVAVGPGGRVVTGGSFTASTLDIPDAAFLNGGDKSFAGTSKATVTNAGSIGSLGGDVALIAREVGNTGTVTAPNGTVGLAAGYEVLVKDGAVEGGKFQVKVGGADTAARTSGRIAAAAAEIRANGGNVYALAGNTGGVVTATGTAEKGGRIYLTAGDTGTVEAGGTVTATKAGENGAVQGGDIRVSGGTATVTGTLSAKGTGAKGGTVAVTGAAVRVTGTAAVDASGSRGGAVAVGGDYQGGTDPARKTLKDNVANARTATVAAGARLSADGTAGDGGSVVVWSDERTVFLGTVSARGAGAGGNGGSAEVSGKATLSFHGTADLTAAAGRTGTLLLDPYNLTISAGADGNVSGLSASGDDSVLGVSTLTAALASANVTVSTGAGGSQAGTITVAAPVAWSADTVLTLAAAGDIAVNAPVTASGAAAGLVLQYGTGKGYSVGGTGSVTLGGANATLRIGEAGSLQSYTLIHDMAALDAIDTTGLTGRYALAQSLDAAGTTYTSAPVSGTFTGTFAGLGNTVSNLTVNAPDTDYIGLFGTLGSGSSLRDFGVVNATVTGKTRVGGVAGATVGTVTNAHATGGSVTGSERVGGLVGSTAAISAVTQSHATASVTGTNHVGGLIGWSQGTVTQTYATGSVTGTGERIGGLLGYHSGTVTQSYATGTVSGAVHVGGLSGWNQGTVTQSHATGNVTGTGESVGGLVGWNASNITESYATGTVTGDTKVGGLVGDNYLTAEVSQSYATGAVSGNTHIGGLVGWHQSGTVTQSHASGGVTGTDNIGGLVGFNSATVTDSYATGTVSGSRYVGGLVGWNQETITQSHATGTVTGDGEAIGGLVGWTSVTVSQSYATGTVSGSAVNLGGLAGSNYGTVTESYATGSVTGSGDNVGGLVGKSQNGIINTVYAAGAVSGSNSVGGLIGDTEGDTVTKAYATGTVSGVAGVGGLIGTLRGGSGSLSESYATGAVTATENKAGGLLGGVEDATVTNVYATGSVTGAIDATDGEHFIGGLVGDKYYGTITNAYATGLVTLSSSCTASDCKAGGLAGRNAEGSINTSYWDKGTTGQAGGAGTGNGTVDNVIGIETADAFGAAAYGNFDLTNTWYLVEGQTRPFLRSEYSTAITNAHQLQLMRLDLSAAYTLATDVDAGETAGSTAAGVWLTSGIKHGFVPVGNSSTPFTGSLDGQGHVIRGLAIKPEDYAGMNQGLFGVIGTAGSVSNLGLTDIAITGTGYIVGGLAGQNGGTITNAYVTGSVQGAPVGGLVGKNTGTITRSYSTATVSQPTVGGDMVGGLVGENTNEITLSYATGDVTGRSTAGGLVGKNSGSISLSYATGAVTGTIGTDVGGLVADNAGAISNSYATGGAVSGNMSVGGLVGMNTGAITQAYTTKAVSGSSMVGGFAGFYASGTITSSYFDTTAAGTNAHAGSQATVTGVTGLTTTEFQNTASFMAGASGWDFDGTWAPPSSGYYPVLYSMEPVLRVKELSATSVYGSSTGTVTGVSGEVSPTTYVFGKAGDSLSLTGGAVTVDPTVTVSATPATTSLTAANATVTSTKGTAYRVFYYGNFVQTVTPAALTITANDATKTYGDTATLGGYTVTGLKNGDSVTGLTLASTGAAATTGVGSYAIAASSALGMGLSNYTVSYTGGTLTVNPAALTITANDATKTYGDTATLNGYTVSGLKNGDSVSSLVLSSGGTAAATGVGSYGITASSALGTGLSNYTVSYTGGTLTVNPATLTITAHDVTKTYGDTAALSGYTVSGLKNGDRVTGLTLSSGGTAAATGVGSYGITASSALGTGLSNYTVSYTGGTLTVNPATLTITAHDVTKTYGDTAALSGYTVSGLKNGDSVSSLVLSSGGTAATAGAGRYGITASSVQGSGLSNYTVSYLGTLTVNPAALTITAHDVTKTYGDTAALSGYMVTGLKNGDSVSSLVLSSGGTAATAGAGRYGITASSAQGSGLSNYTVSYLGGTLTVSARPIMVTADSLSRLAGTANPALTYSVGGRGLVNGDTLTGALATDATTAAPAGTYAITQGTLAASSNYSLSFNPSVLTVTPAGTTGGQQNAETATVPVTAGAVVAQQAQVLTNAVLPRNLVVVTAAPVSTAFQSRDTPASPFASPASQAVPDSTNTTATGVGGGSTGAPASQETAGSAAACTGGAAAGGACTTTPHPENTRVGRFLRFSMR
ncbi:filamentous hemagglutinin family protein [Azospirillum fermentarium]|uniref:MBG domain-containing protein n=1 Tax=Azospirillum fermentarium TaxID=1233114 RepID=UPI0022263751|nr:MBG domain-containing protein [Azospirillum fermentarium]MCW2249061.1 filamentous hemagglutinin family protein [Azospirillum fermentarium]